MTGRWLRRAAFVTAWLGLAVAAERLLAATDRPAWLAVPLVYMGYKVLLDVTLRLLRGRDDLLFLEDILRDGFFFLILGVAAVPLLSWSASLVDARLSAAVPLAVAYLVYTFWPRDDTP